MREGNPAHFSCSWHTHSLTPQHIIQTVACGWFNELNGLAGSDKPESQQGKWNRPTGLRGGSEKKRSLPLSNSNLLYQFSCARNCCLKSTWNVLYSYQLSMMLVHCTTDLEHVAPACWSWNNSKQRKINLYSYTCFVRSPSKLYRKTKQNISTPSRQNILIYQNDAF